MHFRARALPVLFVAWFAARAATPVSDAVHRGHAVGHEQDGVDAVRAALAAGGDVNERDSDGWTPLMHAALECRAQIVALLLERGGDPKLRAHAGRGGYKDSGQTALHIAAGCFIARRRAQVAPERHMPPEYVAYELAAPQKMVRDLIARGADINAADAEGKTPLMMAAMHDWPDVVKTLLAAGAAAKPRDGEGRSAIDYAAPTDRATIDALRKAGASPSGRSGRLVCDVQRALDRLGFGMPIIDCIAGGQFAGDVKKFQHDRKLPETGQLDDATLSALGVRR
jgi:ankyrin repeat protein